MPHRQALSYFSIQDRFKLDAISLEGAVTNDILVRTTFGWQPQSTPPTPWFAAPSLTLGTSNIAGAATTVISSNSTILAFDATAPTTSAVGDSAATGSAAITARRDHRHGRESFATNTVVLSTAAGAGVATTLIRSDATIAAFDTTAPAAVDGTAAATGSAAFAARRDHVHLLGATVTNAITFSAAGTAVTVNNNASIATITFQTGASQATAGELRFGRGGSSNGIQWHNAAGSANLPVLNIDGANQVQLGYYDNSIILIGNGAGNTARPATDGTTTIGTGPSNRFLSAAFSSFVAVGTTVSTTGAIRLANAVAVSARNAANSADVALAQLDASNRLELGLNSLSLVLTNALTQTTAAAGGNSIPTSVAGFLRVLISGTEYVIPFFPQA